MNGAPRFLLRATYYKSISLGFPHLLSRRLCALKYIMFVACIDLSISSCPELVADNNTFLYNVMRDLMKRVLSLSKGRTNDSLSRT